MWRLVGKLSYLLLYQLLFENFGHIEVKVEYLWRPKVFSLSNRSGHEDKYCKSFRKVWWPVAKQAIHTQKDASQGMQNIDEPSNVADYTYNPSKSPGELPSEKLAQDDSTKPSNESPVEHSLSSESYRSADMPSTNEPSPSFVDEHQSVTPEVVEFFSSSKSTAPRKHSSAHRKKNTPNIAKGKSSSSLQKNPNSNSFSVLAKKI